MKKALLVALTLGLICVWAAPAMAIDWTVLGGFAVKSSYYKNIDYRLPYYLGGVPGSGHALGGSSAVPFLPFPVGGIPALFGPADPQWNRDSWFLQMRGNIYVVARASADLQGVFGIEVNSMRFGDADTKVIPYSGFPGGDATSTAGRWNADAIAIQVKSMYIDFKVPEIPVRLKVGIQPLMLRPAVFMYADAAGVTGNIKIPAGDMIFNINPFWGVITHGTWFPAGTGATGIPTDWTTADDGNFFGVDFNAMIGDIKPGVFFAMQRVGQKWNSLPAGTAEGNENLWWLGVYADAKFGPVAVTADFIYNGGYDQWDKGTMFLLDPASALYWGGFGGTGVGNPSFLGYSRRHEAFVTRGVVSYTMNKVTFGVGGLYGTGDNPNTKDKYEGWQVPYRSEAAKFNDDFVVLTGDWGLREPYGFTNVGGFFKAWSNVGQGVWYVRGFADYAVTDWLKLKANFGYIGDTVPHSQDEFGTDNDGDNTIGFEIDAGVQINIYKNLYLDNAFGYLIGGKAAMSQVGGWRAQDPWAFNTALTYVF